MTLTSKSSGLDSTTSFVLIKGLRKLAERGGLTVMLILHQPSYKIFDDFDDLILLVKANRCGHVAYHGPANQAVDYFTNRLSYIYPQDPKVNPADWILDVLQGEYRKTDSERDIPAESLRRKMTLRWREVHKEFIPPLPSLLHKPSMLPRRRGTWWHQACTILEREHKLDSRRSYSMILCVIIAVGTAVGIIRAYNTSAFAKVPTANFFLSMGATLVFTVHSLSIFGDDRPMRSRELAAGTNPLAYFTGKAIYALKDVVFLPVALLAFYHASLLILLPSDQCEEWKRGDPGLFLRAVGGFIAMESVLGVMAYFKAWRWLLALIGWLRMQWLFFSVVNLFFFVLWRASWWRFHFDVLGIMMMNCFICQSIGMVISLLQDSPVSYLVVVGVVIVSHVTAGFSPRFQQLEDTGGMVGALRYIMNGSFTRHILALLLIRQPESSAWVDNPVEMQKDEVLELYSNQERTLEGHLLWAFMHALIWRLLAVYLFRRLSISKPATGMGWLWTCFAASVKWVDGVLLWGGDTIIEGIRGILMKPFLNRRREDQARALTAGKTNKS